MRASHATESVCLFAPKSHVQVKKEYVCIVGHTQAKSPHKLLHGLQLLDKFLHLCTRVLQPSLEDHHRLCVEWKQSCSGQSSTHILT